MNSSGKDSLESMPSLHPIKYKRYALMLLGHLALLAGAIGILLPIVPTSPFVLLAAYCYARSSKRFYLFLLNNKYFGENIRQWEESRCIARRIKALSLLTLLIMFSVTIFVFLQDVQAQIWVGVFALIAISVVLLVPSCERKQALKKKQQVK